MSARMKSSSAGPDFDRISRARAALEAWLRSISSVTIAGSVSIGAGAWRGGGAPGASSGSDGRKPSRSTIACSAPPTSGSGFHSSSMPARVAGEARARVTSTNSLPPASYIRGMAISCQTESPRGFIGSVIIC